jgi:hypothetical protein
MTGQIPPNDELKRDGLAGHRNRHVWVWNLEYMVGDEVSGRLEEVSSDLIKHLPLEWDGLSQYVIEGGYAIRGDQY